jgi:hypothetical protein
MELEDPVMKRTLAHAYDWASVRFITGSSSSISNRAAGRMPPIAPSVPPNITVP